MGNAAKLPANLIEPPRRTVSDLKVGETAYALYHAMIVTVALDCYLKPDGTLTNSKGDNRILIERRADGYHVTIIAKDSSWCTTQTTVSSAIAVASIREEYDPDLEWAAKMKRLDELTKKTSETVASVTANIDEQVAKSKELRGSHGGR
jgi:hypothetical protein